MSDKCGWSADFRDTPRGKERWWLGWVFPGDRCAWLDLELTEYRVCASVEGP
jgi:hypothetical protein